MIAILRELRREHRGMARLLDSLERQIAKVEAGRAPDYEIVEALVDFFLDFPDACHHPKEDLVFAKLRLRDPRAAAQVGDLHAEHEELAELTLRFADGFDWMLEDPALPGDWFEHGARQFADFLRRHIAIEEEVLFPAAERALEPFDWTEIDAAFTLSGHSLSDDPAKRRFDVLYDEVLILDEVDCPEPAET